MEPKLELIDCLTSERIKFRQDSKFDLVFCGFCMCYYRPCIQYLKNKNQAKVYLKCPKCGSNDRIKTTYVSQEDDIPLVVSN